MLNLFLQYFRNGIKDLIRHFPENARNTHKETGADLGPFWHGHKRFPQIGEWDATNEKYIEFVYHSTNILVNQVFELKTKVDESTIKKICQEFKPAVWEFSGGKIEVEEDENEDGKEEKKEEDYGDDDVKELEKLRETLKAVDVSAMADLKSADFEKDDEKNHHIDIITSATNLRAWNYRIKETNAAHCRMIAGKIIPAIATTTACITGFIGLEVMKLCRKAELEAHRMVTINLAVNNISMELLPDPKKKKTGLDPETYMTMKAIPEGFTCWDFVEINEPDVTLQQFLDAFKKAHHDCTITLLGAGVTSYYNDSDQDSKEKMGKKLIDIVTEANKGPIVPEDRNYCIFDSVMVTDNDGDDGNVPKIKWIFK